MAIRLNKNGIPLDELYEMSLYYYKTFENKKERMRMDVISGTMQSRKNYKYDKSIRDWVQTGRDVLFIFLVRTNPVSYKKQDSIKIHKYPVYFLIHDISLGLSSPFKFRTGSMKKPLFVPKGALPKVRQRIIDTNIRNMVQLQFFYELEWILQWNSILYGRSWANRPPMKANPQLLPFFDKHSLRVYEKLLRPILSREENRAKLLKLH
jgi:hypothetical protein